MVRLLPIILGVIGALVSFLGLASSGGSGPAVGMYYVVFTLGGFIAGWLLGAIIRKVVFRY